MTTDREIITRAQAKAQGLKRFFTGRPCKRGHVAERNAANGTCVECDKIKQHEAHVARLQRAANGSPVVMRKDARRLRAEARRAGLTRYFTGKPCTHGHVAERLVCDGGCVECARLRSYATYKADPDAHNADQRARRAKDVERSRAYHRKWHAEHPEQRKATSKAYREANADKFREYSMVRHAKKLKAMPRWADRAAIKAFYMNCPDGYEVDHIVPLQGKNVCGLHVADNLQYLTKPDNIRKHNRHNPDEHTHLVPVWLDSLEWVTA